MNKPFKLLICDLDNTLYDWVTYFVPSFYAMVDKVVELLNCDREQLLDDFREVHQRHHDTEHPFALLETHTVNEHFKGWERKKILAELNPAFHAFNSARIKHLILHTGVRQTLEYVIQCGIKVVAHTDSQIYGAVDRLNRLNLKDYFIRVYCRVRPETQHPNIETEDWINNRFPEEKITELSNHQMKPDPLVLEEICKVENVSLNEAAYVGDSIARDILMAKKIGVFGIWAKYGSTLHSDDYEKLVRISHWTKEDVQREKQLKKEAYSIQPDFIIENSFTEILSVLFQDEQIAVI
ncbi:MAG: HAD family hydrolase [Nitrospirae bacterium]|nr:HAD family hydrolase [Nitrospirota bacterium]